MNTLKEKERATTNVANGSRLISCTISLLGQTTRPRIPKERPPWTAVLTGLSAYGTFVVGDNGSMGNPEAYLQEIGNRLQTSNFNLHAMPAILVIV